jgi:hypothetical protein
MPKYGLWGPTLGLVIGQTWSSFYLGARTLKRYQLPVSQLCQWNKLGLALLASLAGIAAVHVSMHYLPSTPAGMLAGLTVFGLVYLIAARLILREEYSYVMRAILRRKAA